MLLIFKDMFRSKSVVTAAAFFFTAAFIINSSRTVEMNNIGSGKITVVGFGVMVMPAAAAGFMASTVTENFL